MLRSPLCSSDGSPGARWITTNDTNVMPSRSGRASSRRRRAYASMERLFYVRPPPRRSAGGVALKVLGYEPVGEVPLDPGRAGVDAEDPVGDDRQRIAPVEEDDRLVVGQHLVQTMIEAHALRLVAGRAAGLEQRVDLGIGVRDVVEVVGPHLRGVPHDVLVGIGARAPPEHDRVELALLDVLLEEGRPFQDADLDGDTQLAQRGLDDLGNLLALVVALVGQQLEGERLAVLLQRPAVAALPAGLGQQGLGALEVVGDALHRWIIRPGARPERPGGGAAEAEHDAVE